MYGLKFLLELHKEELTYDYLVRILGISSKGTIGNWIARKRVPKEENIRRLAKELDVEEYYINKQLTKEEQEWLRCRYLYKKLKPKYEEIKIDYYDSNTEIYHKGMPVIGQSSESRYEEECLRSIVDDEKLKVNIIKFINDFNTMDDESSARAVIYSLMEIVDQDVDRLKLMNDLLLAIDTSLKQDITMINAVDGDIANIEKLSMAIAKNITSTMYIETWE